MKRDEIEWRSSWLSDWQGEYWLVEPSVGASYGLPDAHLVDQSFAPAWVEFKALDGDGFFKMRPAQRLFFKRFTKHSDRACVVVLDGKGFWVIPGRSIAASQIAPLNPSSLPRARYWPEVKGSTREGLRYAFA